MKIKPSSPLTSSPWLGRDAELQSCSSKEVNFGLAPMPMCWAMAHISGASWTTLEDESPRMSAQRSEDGSL